MDKIIVFKIENQRYGIELNYVLEVLNDMKIDAAMPSTNKYFLGLMNIRGNIASVINLANVLEQSSIEDTKSFVVCVYSDERIVFPITMVERILEIEEEMKVTSPEIVESAIVEEVLNENDSLIQVLNFEELIKKIKSGR